MSSTIVAKAASTLLSTVLTEEMLPGVVTTCTRPERETRNPRRVASPQVAEPKRLGHAHVRQEAMEAPSGIGPECGDLQSGSEGHPSG